MGNKQKQTFPPQNLLLGAHCLAAVSVPSRSHLVIPGEVWCNGEVDAQQTAGDGLHVRRQLQAGELVHKLVLHSTNMHSRHGDSRQ